MRSILSEAPTTVRSLIGIGSITRVNLPQTPPGLDLLFQPWFFSTIANIANRASVSTYISQVTGNHPTSTGLSRAKHIFNPGPIQGERCIYLDKVVPCIKCYYECWTVTKFLTIQERRLFESIATSWAEIHNTNLGIPHEGSLRSPLVQLRYTFRGSVPRRTIWDTRCQDVQA